MSDGRPGRALTIWVRVAAFTEEADVVEHLRLIIEQNTQALRAQQEVGVLISVYTFALPDASAFKRIGQRDCFGEVLHHLRRRS